MKGKYSGRYMTIYGHTLPGTLSLASWAAKVDNISDKARQKLKVIDWLRLHNNNISLAARHYGLTRETIGIWLKNFHVRGIAGLNDKSHLPNNMRVPTTDKAIIIEIIKTRKKYPAWSKYKIASILRRKGMIVSPSTVGRTFKRRGLINKKVSRKRSKAAKHPKKRFPKGFRISNPGDMIQIDTKHITLIGGLKIYQFTAIDVLTKRRVLRYYASLTSKNGAEFLRYCLAKFPFPIKNIQTDNGSEFLKYFDELCKSINLPHYFIYPRTPKQNTYVESSHLADKNEFYSQGNIGCSIEVMQKRLEEWEYIWNCIRPHESLDYLTPEEYLNKWQTSPLPTVDTLVLQA